MFATCSHSVPVRRWGQICIFLAPFSPVHYIIKSKSARYSHVGTLIPLMPPRRSFSSAAVGVASGHVRLLRSRGGFCIIVCLTVEMMNTVVHGGPGQLVQVGIPDIHASLPSARQARFLQSMLNRWKRHHQDVLGGGRWRIVFLL